MHVVLRHPTIEAVIQRGRLVRVVGVLAIVFGLLTLKAGGNMLFGDGQSHVGPVVPFVLWFNFVAAFGYVAAGLGLLTNQRWSERLALGLAVATLAVFAVFGAHVAHGGEFAPRTVGALTIRSVFWVTAAWIARATFRARTPLPA